MSESLQLNWVSLSKSVSNEYLLCLMISSITTRSHKPGLSIDHKTRGRQCRSCPSSLLLFSFPALSLCQVEWWQRRRVQLECKLLIISMWGNGSWQEEVNLGLSSQPSLSFVDSSWVWGRYRTLYVNTKQNVCAIMTKLWFKLKIQPCYANLSCIQNLWKINDFRVAVQYGHHAQLNRGRSRLHC